MINNDGQSINRVDKNWLDLVRAYVRDYFSKNNLSNYTFAKDNFLSSWLAACTCSFYPPTLQDISRDISKPLKEASWGYASSSSISLKTIYQNNICVNCSDINCFDQGKASKLMKKDSFLMERELSISPEQENMLLELLESFRALELLSEYGAKTLYHRSVGFEGVPVEEKSFEDEIVSI